MDASTSLRRDDDTPQLSVCVVGLGYIGLPTSAVLADAGIRVYGCDVREEVVETINRGEIHIYEPQLDRLVHSVVRRELLSCATTPHEADVFMLCVPTPIRDDKSPDVSYVEKASQAIRPFVREGNLVILESTSPPGTTDDVVAPHAIPDQMQIGSDVFVAHCPERVLPGRILEEAIHNDRVVGGITPRCTEQATAFYQRFVKGQVLGTTAVGAELSKLAENAFRDVNIAFANELSVVADHLGADVWEIIRLANRHPRVDILQPGPGVGGHCISVDPWFLVHSAPDQSKLMRTAREVNDAKPNFVVEQVRRAAGALEQPVIGCLGLAYKPDVDDFRESPSLQIVETLARQDVGELLVCEPFAGPAQFAEYRMATLDRVLERSDIIVLLTDHSEFRELDAARLEDKIVIDTRGAWREHVTSGNLPAVARRAA
jgi:UDP-N-acetyl-D-mannosaminuronic acid dehydrogenase